MKVFPVQMQAIHGMGDTGASSFTVSITLSTIFIAGVINTGVNVTVGPLATGINDTDGQFVAGVVDTREGPKRADICVNVLKILPVTEE